MAGREIGYFKVQKSSDDRNSAAGWVNGEGDKTGTYAPENTWIPMYGFNYLIHAPDVNTIQAQAPKPVDQKPVVITKLLHNATPEFFQMHVSKKGIWLAEFHLMKSTGQEAEAIALKLTLQNGIVTQWETFTEQIKGLDAAGKYAESMMQFERIHMVFTEVTVENFKLTHKDKTTMGNYSFREPNKGSSK